MKYFESINFVRAGPGVVLTAISIVAGEPAVSVESGIGSERAVDIWTGENVNLGGVLFPHFHFNAAYGTSSGETDELAAGHHDPAEGGVTIQGIHFGLSARINEYFEAFGVWDLSYNPQTGKWVDGIEESFAKIKNLPGGFELRGGRYLNRFGFHNATHLHGWDWADTYLVTGRVFGDDGLVSDGGELTWNLPLPWTSAASVSAGRVKRHEHAHEHAGDEEPEFNAEGWLFDDWVFAANWTNAWNLNDFHQFRGGVSTAWGDNVWEKSTRVFGGHLEYQWRQNGLEPGGDYFRLRMEIMTRSLDALSGELPGHSAGHGAQDEDAHAEHDQDAHGDEGDDRRAASFDELGLYVSGHFGFDLNSAGLIETAARYEYVSGNSGAGLPERHRVSPGATWYNDRGRRFFIRTQYNLDWLGGGISEHSVWAQIGINWGGAEVR